MGDKHRGESKDDPLGASFKFTAHPARWRSLEKKRSQRLCFRYAAFDKTVRRSKGTVQLSI